MMMIYPLVTSVSSQPKTMSAICRPEHVYYCMAVLDAELNRREDPDPTEFLEDEEREKE